MTPLHVLIVDDEPAIRSGIRKLLSSLPDIQVAGECQSAAEAVQAIQRGGIDLVLLDIHLPDASGLDVARNLRAPGVPASLRESSTRGAAGRILIAPARHPPTRCAPIERVLGACRA